MAQFIKINPEYPETEKIETVARLILDGKIIAYPTETVYGLGANIFNAHAVKQVYEIKGRTYRKAMIVIVSSISELAELVSEIPVTAQRLIDAFWPGPLTLIFRASQKVPAEILCFGNTIAIRIPDNRICLELLKMCQVPITSTSANKTGAPNPISAQDVQLTLGRQINLIVDGGNSTAQTPSTLVDVTSENIKIVREGVVKIQEIERFCKVEKGKLQNI